MSKKNIITYVVAGLAAVLLVVVVLVETGVINSDLTKQETVIESEVIVVSETNEQGEVEYLTMVTKYAKPKVSSKHTYATKATTKRKTTTATQVKYVEQSSFVHLTDENGIPLFNDDGSPVTEVVTYTVREDSITTSTKAPPKTSAVAVTNENGEQQTDESGNAVTEVVTYTEAESATTDLWSSNTDSTTSILNIETSITRDDTLAQTIVNQINADREAAGLEPLTHATGLKASARTNCYVLAKPDIYGDNQISGAYTLITPYGGNPVYQTIAAANKDKVMSADTTQIGIGVIKYNDQYYTTVLFG